MKVALLMSAAFSSCISEVVINGMEENDPITMAIYNNSLDQSGKVPDYGFAEKVMSLLIIMLN